MSQPFLAAAAPLVGDVAAAPAEPASEGAALSGSPITSIGSNDSRGTGEGQPSAADDRAQFESFVQRFHKVYHSDAERELRFATFRANLATIRAENAKGHPYTLGITQFADETPHEFGLKFSKPLPPQKDLVMLGVHEHNDKDVPASRDWSAEGAVTEVKNQGKCGSCWSFATTGTLEGAWKIATGQLLSLSEQQLMDCSSNEKWGNQGCDGGAVEQALAYLQTGQPVCNEVSYDYQEALGKQCLQDGCRVGIPAYGVKGFKRVADTPGDDTALLSAVAQQPVAVAIEADRNVFQHYTSGVIKLECGDAVNHGVLLVGYGNDKDAGDYWILKNSWGDTWGEYGFARLERGVSGQGECGIKEDPVYAVVDGSKANPPDIMASLIMAGITVAVLFFFLIWRCIRKRVRSPDLTQGLAAAGSASVAPAAAAAAAPAPDRTAARAAQAQAAATRVAQGQDAQAQAH